MRVALEPTRPQFAHVAFVHSLRDALALAAATDLWLVLDTAHLWWEPGLPALLADAVPRCAAVQLADLGFGWPGPRTGGARRRWTAARSLRGRAWSHRGFAGPFELEIIGQSIDEEGYGSAVGRSLRHLDGLLGRLPS